MVHNEYLKAISSTQTHIPFYTCMNGVSKKQITVPQNALRGYCIPATFKMELEGWFGHHSKALDLQIPKHYRLSGSDGYELSYGHFSVCGP